jgi:cytochrome bd-type quinol oxidase subunit 2
MNTAIREVDASGGTQRDASVPEPHRSWGRFARHYAEMSLVMVIGMIVAVTTFMYVLNIADERIKWEEVLTKYPAQALLAVAIGMSVPMIPWMRWRGHSKKSAYEMAIVMAVPAIPFICLALLDIVEGAQCGLYCIVGFAAMFVLMLLRRNEYGTN